MSADREKLAKEIFADALEKVDAAERAACLTHACGDDAELRRRVDALLRAYERAGAFLDEPAASPPGRTIGPGAELTEKVGDKIGPYKLLQPIGEGGCGVVYMAEQVEPIRRRVALKIVKLGMGTRQVIARFEAERQALALMDHPNISRVLDAGASEAGRPYFVMELVRGVKLTDYCDQENLSTPQRLDLFVQVCHAIRHAHQKGIIHRDIKPSNILVTVIDGRPVPKVIDFGIAKAIGQQLTDKTLFTAFEQFIGTPAYMSPEQATLSGVDVDTRSDIYSLGVLLYELLTGHTPFDPKTLVSAGLDEMRRLIREEDPPRPSTRIGALSKSERTTVARRRQSEAPRLIHQVRGDLDWIAMKCLEKDRARRYETANALALDIEHHLNHQPVIAAAPSALYRAGKFARRHQVGLATSIAFVLLLAAGTVVSTREAVQANRARALAERREAEARQHLRASHLTAARASRTSGRTGRRFDALDAAAKAAAIFPSVELRSEAASALALVDVRTGREWDGCPPGTMGLVVDRQFERYAHGDKEGHVTVRRVSDDQELLSLPGMFTPVLFSHDGRFLFGTDCGRTLKFAVWNVDSGRLVLDEAGDPAYCPAADFHPQAPILAAATAGGIDFFDLTTGKRWPRAPTITMPGAPCFRPDGRQLAVSGSQEQCVRVFDLDSGALVSTLRHSNTVRCVDWSADGRWLAVPCDDGRIYLWNMREGAMLDRVLEGHESVVTRVCFDPQGEFLVSQAWDGTSALWSLPLSSLLLKLPGCDFPMSFSADGRWLGPFVAGRAVRLLEVTRAPACRVLPAGIGNAQGNGAFSADGRWIVLGGEGLQCWDSRTGQRVWTEPAGPIRWVMFRPNRPALVAFDETGPREWPWSEDASTGAPRLGTPRRLPGGRSSQAEYSRDGSVLVMAQVEGLRVVDTRTPAPRLFPMRMCNFAAVSPDGRWAAASPWSDDSELKVWDLASQQEVFRRPKVGSVLAFTPNGRWLVRVWDDYECLEVGTWRTVTDAPRDPGVILFLAVSPDSRWLALEHGGHGRLHLLELPTFRPFLALDAASESPVCFSPDGTRLLTRRSGGQFALWDLGLVRAQLSPLGLGW